MPTTLSPNELAVVHADIDDCGYAHLRGLPDGFDHAAAVQKFGLLVPQYGGELVRDIRPDPAHDGMVSALNTGRVWPHTEWYEVPGLPPRYVALWCVQPADGPGGETTLVDGKWLLEAFTDAELQQLREPVYHFGASASLARVGVNQRARHEIITDHNDATVIRFSTLDLSPDTELVQRWIVTGVEIHAAHHTALKLDRGDLLIWDNWRMLHARTAFRDCRRHLRRALLAHAGE